MDDTLIIEPRFNGPRLSGNGGYVGGVMAGRFTEAFGGDGTVEITRYVLITQKVEKLSHSVADIPHNRR